MKMPNGYGSIAKLKGTRRRPWMTRVTVGWTDGGREIRRVIGYYRTRTEALAALADFRRAPYDIDERRTTFADLYDDWTRSAYTNHGAAVPTTYAAAFKRLPHLHGMQFADIRARHALGRPHLPHDSRHTCATMLDNAGVNLKTSQLILGHRADDITRRVYTHKTIQQLIDAINCI